MVYYSGEGHIPSALSIADILYILYDRILNVNPRQPDSEDRDYFVLSKGHGCAALYSILVEKGFFDRDELKSYCKKNSFLGGHPDRNKVPGVEASTGSLGHGFPIAIGIALSMKIRKRKNKVFTLIGDGESNEGSIWESAQVATNLKLDNLIVIVDNNNSQRYSAKFDYINTWKSFGWETSEVDGHDHVVLEKTIEKYLNIKDKPKVIIANTVKGKGVSLMENNPEWHHKCPDDESYQKIIAELA